MPNYHELIVTKVNQSTGRKSVELAIAIMSDMNPGAFDMRSYQAELGYAVKQKEIVELEYILPASSHKIDRIYFPKGTILHSYNGKKILV